MTDATSPPDDPAAVPSAAPEPPSPELVELAAAHGVATDFWDWQGRHTVVTRESVEAVLAADTVLFTVPNQLGVEYNARILDTIARHIAPAIGWRPAGAATAS